MTAGEPVGPRRLATAAEWFARTRDADARLDVWTGLTRWLEADPRNADAFAQVERAWAAADAVEPVSRPRRARGTPRRALLAGGLLAASVAAALVVGPQVLEPAAPTTVYTAPAGQVRQVLLADGTQVRLSPQSRMSVTLRRDRREVVLQDAEAFFDVTHDATRPFTITAGDTAIRVVGTRFGVRTRAGDTSVSVERGVVEFGPAEGGRRVRLTKGQRADRAAGGEPSVSAAQPDADYGWVDRARAYRQAPLSRVVADMSRDLGVPIRIADGALGTRPFTGVMRLDADTPALMRRLSAFAGVTVSPEGAGYEVSRP